MRECREWFIGVAKKALLDAKLSEEKSFKAKDAVKAVSLEHGSTEAQNQATPKMRQKIAVEGSESTPVS